MRAHFLGAGLHTALGQDRARLVAALQQAPPTPQMIRVEIAATRYETPALMMADLPWSDIEHRLDRAIDGVVRAAIDEAELTAADRRDTALFLGTSSLDISVTEAVYRRELAAGEDAYPLTANSCMGRLGESVRRRFGLGAADLTFNTACTASANALLAAAAMVQSGRCRFALVLGVEAFNVITALGFSALDLLAPGAMKPFDRDRRGLVIGEGCAALVIAAAPRGRRGMHLMGGANLCDTYGVSASNPDGSTVARVMRNALSAAGARPEDVGVVKAHGTASLLNDEAEAAGLARLFPRQPMLCALKPFVGHTFGACGLIELLLMTTAAEAGFVPGTPGVACDSDLGVVLNQGPTARPPGPMLLNYFGFGGNNTSLVIGHDDD